MRSGEGTITYSNGDKYTGSFKKNLFDGYGTLTLQDGSIKKGMFKANKFIDNSKK